MPPSRELKAPEIVEESDVVVVGDSALEARPKASPPVKRGYGPPPRKSRRPAAPPGRGCMGTCAYFSGLSLLVMTLVIACMALVMTFEVASFMRDPLDNFLAVFGFDPDADPQIVDSRTIVLGIKEMAVLQTTSGDILISKTVVDSGAAPDAEITVNYIGSVTAGIDMALVTEDHIIIDDGGRLAVILPPAQLTGCYLGKPDIVKRQCTGIPLAQDCGQIVERLQSVAFDRALDELRETAFELDLLELSYQEAESRLYELLHNLGYSDISFQRSNQVLPPSPTCFAE